MKKWIVANWKMNGDKNLLHSYEDKFHNEQNMIVCTPFVYFDNSLLNFGGQNVSHLTNGAYTGEINAKMLAEVGVKYCLVGHSERRQFFGETNDLVKQKALQCIAFGITPIICIGENLKEYLDGITEEVLIKQLQNCLPDSSNFWIAYEPLWAIGSGKTPNNDEITKIHNMIKLRFPEIVLLYGGSVNAKNAKEILLIESVDGVLVGGASLDIASISTIYDCT